MFLKQTNKPTTKEPFLKARSCQVVVVNAFYPNTWRQNQSDLCEFEASLVYRVSSRTARATEKACLEKKKKEFQKQQFIKVSLEVLKKHLSG